MSARVESFDNRSQVAWLCRWQDQRLVVWADSIEQARLEARRHAGPTAAVSARLATNAEKGER